MKEEKNGENLVLYEKLRENILQNEIAITNETIYMYVTYFALFTLGASWGNWLFILSCVVLIVFQSMINDAYWAVIKTSLFIDVFFENTRDDIHWEQFHSYDPYIKLRKARMYGFSWSVKEFGASILSFVSLAAFLSQLWGHSVFSLSRDETIQLCIATILCIFAIYTNTRHFYFYKKGNSQTNLRKCVEDYYKKCYPPKESKPPQETAVR